MLSQFALFLFLGVIVCPLQSSPLKPGLQKTNKDLKQVLQYYRLQVANSELPADSAEGESAELEPAKKPSFRIELSSGDESSPYASYQYEEKNVSKNATQAPEETETSTAYPIENFTGSAKLDMFEDGEESSTEEACNEGEIQKIDCNTCVCSDGSFVCSKKNCTTVSTSSLTKTQFGQMFLSHETLAEKKHQMASDLNIKSWKKKIQSTTPLPDCSTGMVKSIDCNQCICAQQKWACTKRSCIALTLREKASYSDGSIIKKVDSLQENHKLDEDCLEDQTMQMGCNQCVCHWNSWSCTNVTCMSTPEPYVSPDVMMPEIEEACQREGDVKSKECNLCKCRRGVWVCTTNDCQKLGDKKGDPPGFRSSSKITKDKDI